jgi:hypothetical protein
MIKRLSFWNAMGRITFLLLAPAFFRLFNSVFIWYVNNTSPGMLNQKSE